MTRSHLAASVVASIVLGLVLPAIAQEMRPKMQMGGMMAGNAPVVPAVTGYSEGQAGRGPE